MGSPASSAMPICSMLRATTRLSSLLARRNQPCRPKRPIITTSRTVTGKRQSTTSLWGT